MNKKIDPNNNDINRIFRFRDFKVYEDTRKFSKALKDFSQKRFPRKEKFGLTSQLWRALDSVILNIAEGSNKATDKEFALFLNRSRTSMDEVVACLDVALDDEYISYHENDHWIKNAAKITEQLTSFRKHVLSTQKK